MKGVRGFHQEISYHMNNHITSITFFFTMTVICFSMKYGWSHISTQKSKEFIFCIKKQSLFYDHPSYCNMFIWLMFWTNVLPVTFIECLFKMIWHKNVIYALFMECFFLKHLVGHSSNIFLNVVSECSVNIQK